MNNELALLAQIVAVARTGSFTRAAQELNTTQSALSRNVAAFEARHAVRLFERGRSGAVPTSVGAAVIKDAKSLLRSARAFRENVDLYRLGQAGLVSVGLGPLLASIFLPRLSEAILRERPGLHLSATIRSIDHLFEELMDDNLEVIFGNSTQVIALPETVSVLIGKLELAIFVRKGHPLTGRSGLSMEQLAEFPVASAVQLPTAGLTGENGSFTCDNYHILRETVLASDCVWLSSSQFVADDVTRGTIARLDVPALLPDETFVSAAYRRGRALSPAAAALIERVRALIS